MKLEWMGEQRDLIEKSFITAMFMRPDIKRSTL